MRFGFKFGLGKGGNALNVTWRSITFSDSKTITFSDNNILTWEIDDE